MNIKLTDDGEIVMSAEELSSFAKRKVRTNSLEYKPAGDVYGDPDIFSSLSYKTIKDGEVFIITGEPDGIYTFGTECIVEMRRKVKKVSPSSNPYSDPAFLAKSYVCAFLVCKKKMRDSVTLKIALCGDNGEKYYDFALNISILSRITDDLLERSSFFAIVEKNFCIRGKQDITKMPFPYSSIRDGQKDFVKEAYRTIKRGGRLLVSAPTGIGKTVSALFPAVKAVGEGIVDKVFYLTAKTVTGLTAAKTSEEMAKSAPDLRAIMISAKERCCPAHDKKIDFFVERCSYDCPRLADNEKGDYNSRRDSAMRELLSSKNVFDKSDLTKAAEKYGICPYELSLDLSEYCQIVICDYNYAFDPKVKFRRYFVEGDLKYAFLIDEAHNLPDRARDTFSGAIERKKITALRDALSSSPVPDTELIMQCDHLIEALDLIAETCLENSEISGNMRTGYIIDDHVPEKLIKSADTFRKAASKSLLSVDDQAHSEAIDEATTCASDFITASEYFDEHFVFFAELHGDRLTARVMCLDPSDILDRAIGGAHAAILFSATLTPSEYFADVTGCPSAAFMELESPYSTDNLCVAAVDTISTKYIERSDTASAIAEFILAAITSKAGHYIAYFPSYKYMQTVFNAFCAVAPKGISAVVQKSGMSLDARRKFLSFFEKEDTGETLVGFCVLGGIFSEGIDLPDERLIGAILVGIGLPGLSSELNILKEYYDRTRENGYDFAYLYPAMIKIAQAAGRVIRGEGDRGIIVLIDDRYKDPGIIKLLPSHWKNFHYTGDCRSLSKYLSKFWNESEN